MVVEFEARCLYFLQRLSYAILLGLPIFHVDVVDFLRNMDIAHILMDLFEIFIQIAWYISSKI